MQKTNPEINGKANLSALILSKSSWRPGLCPAWTLSELTSIGPTIAFALWNLMSVSPGP